MTHLRIILDAEGAWPDLKSHPRLDWASGSVISIAALPGGMQSGRPSIAIRIDLPDGRVVVAETSLRAFQTAAKAFTARFGEEPTPKGEDA